MFEQSKNSLNFKLSTITVNLYPLPWTTILTKFNRREGGFFLFFPKFVGCLLSNASYNNNTIKNSSRKKSINQIKSI